MKAILRYTLVFTAVAVIAAPSGAQTQYLRFDNRDVNLPDGWETEIVPASEVMTYTDLGIGTLWATCDLGACHARPEDIGLPFNGALQTDYEKVVAKAIGKSWRLPTPEELETLLGLCEWELIDGQKTNAYGVKTKLYKVTGPNGNHILFPCDDQCYITSQADELTSQRLCLSLEDGGHSVANVKVDLESMFCIRPVSTLQRQTLNIESGWNWFSLFVEPQKDLAATFADGFTNGDCIKSNSEMKFNQYDARDGWKNTGDMALQTLGSAYMYQLNSAAPHTVNIDGMAAEPNVEAQCGWNWVAYQQLVPSEINTALKEFRARPGDIVKSQTAYATYNGFIWYGTLTELEPGRGYMIYSNNPNPVRFRYNTSGTRSTSPATAALSHLSIVNRKYPSNMTATLSIDGIGELSPNMRLVATVADEMRGETAPIVDPATGEYIFMLTLSGDKTAPVDLTLYDGDTPIATAQQAFNYSTDAQLGEIGEPAVVQMNVATSCIYPTPFRQVLHIVHTLSDTQAPALLLITNASGQVVDRINCTPSGGQINVAWDKAASVPAGVYFVTIYENGNPVKTHKTIKLN